MTQLWSIVMHLLGAGQLEAEQLIEIDKLRILYNEVSIYSINQSLFNVNTDDFTC